MRRLAPPLVVTTVGLVLLADFVLANPTLDAVADLLAEYLVLLAAAAALAGAAALVARHGGALYRRQGRASESTALLVGLGIMLIAGLRPGSTGADDPATRWLVAALLVPLAASLFGLLFFFTLAAARRGIARHPRDTTLMLVAAGVVLVLLLPLGGNGGALLAAAGAWVLTVPIEAVFRGLLIGIGVATAVFGARIVLGVDAADE